MNKKFLCGILACAMAIGSLFPMAACKEKPEQGLGGNSGNGGNGGNSGNGGNNNGNNGGTGENNGSVIEPGTVITDQTVKSALYDSLSKAELSGFTYSASANLSVTAGQATQAQKLVAEGSVLLSDEKISADVCAYVTGSDGEDEISQYMLLFVRSGRAYTANGDWHGEGSVNVPALKAQLKATEDPIVLNKDDLSGAVSSVLKTPAVMKVMKNLPSLFDGVITKTEGGYSLEFDVLAAVGNILDGVGTLAAAVDANHNMTLGGLYGQAFIKNTLNKLFNGITAEELLEMVKTYLPKEIFEALPEAAANATAASYIEGLLRSGSFYTALTGGGEEWKDWKTFAEVPLTAIAGLFTGGEFDFGEIKLQEMVEEFKEKLEFRLVSMMLEMLSLGEGTVSDENIDLTVGFSFDDDKKLLGFSLDGLTTGTLTPAPEESGEEDGEEGDEAAPTVQEAESDGKKVARGTIKLEAASASAPELFDLSGCKYYTEDGGTATIKAEK